MQNQSNLQSSVTLFFPDLTTLWSFAKTLPTHNIEINARTFSLTCCCTGDDVQRALQQYGARQVNEQQLAG